MRNDLDTNTNVNTAGAYISTHGRYPFVLGARLHQGCIPLIRIGGHREGDETGWQCAAREAYEETNLRIRPLTPATTYWVDGDHFEAELKKIDWKAESDQETAPVLVVSYYRAGQTVLSLMYLAEADELPVPSSEVTGLLLLAEKDVHQICREAITLEQYLAGGGQAILTGAFDHKLVLEPFVQLRLLSRILSKMQTESFTVRSARSDDLAALPEIERAAAAQFLTTSYPTLVDAALASTQVDLDHEYVWVVVTDTDQPVGFAIVHLLDGSVHLHELDVHPRYARKGLGRRLITTIVDWARNRGARALTLTTFRDVPWNGPYYARLGFRTLDGTTLSPALQAILQAEAAFGLPMANRICMQLDL
jgi:GNAT superfamily N-acetyltransferase